MKILWISHFLLYPKTGYGALQRSRNLLVELSRRHDIFYLSYCRKVDLSSAWTIDQARIDLEAYCRKVVFVDYEPDRVPRYRLVLSSLLSGLPYSVRLYRSDALVQRAKEIIREHRIDLVHADTLGLAEPLLEMEGPQMALTHHNVESQMMFRRAEKAPPLQRLFFALEARRLKAYEQHYCGRYDLNLVVSETDRDRLQALLPGVSATVIENSADCHYYEHHLRSPESRGLLFIGPLHWYPNADALLYFCDHVWPHLVAAMPDLTLTVIGKEPPERLLQMAGRYKGIRLEGYVPDVRPFARKARAFICPIRDGGGTRLKILDAMSQGIPMVSTSIGCEGLRVTDNEHLLLADTPETFVRQTLRLLTDLELCNRLSQNARRWVEEHCSAEAVGARLSQSYERLISSD
jgi:glycosyltransferase involved in cell wall biosynthesis